MSDLIERLRSPTSGNVLLCRKAADEIERLRNELDDAINKAYEEFAKYEADIERLERLYGGVKNDMRDAGKVIASQQAEIERLRAVVDAATHLLAGGDKEAVYHLEKALAALENDEVSRGASEEK